MTSLPSRRHSHLVFILSNSTKAVIKSYPTPQLFQPTIRLWTRFHVQKRRCPLTHDSGRDLLVLVLSFDCPSYETHFPKAALVSEAVKTALDSRYPPLSSLSTTPPNEPTPKPACPDVHCSPSTHNPTQWTFEHLLSPDPRPLKSTLSLVPTLPPSLSTPDQGASSITSSRSHLAQII